MPPAIVANDDAVDINSATIDELTSLPQIGRSLAERVVDHRNRYGHFRRTEDLLLIEGISDRRFREIRHMIVAK